MAKMSDSERISAIENYLHLSSNALAKEIGLKNPQTLYDIHKGRHGISKGVAGKIAGKYLNIDFSWVLSGEGEMLNDVNHGRNLKEWLDKHGFSEDQFAKMMNLTEEETTELISSRLIQDDMLSKIAAHLHIPIKMIEDGEDVYNKKAQGAALAQRQLEKQTNINVLVKTNATLSDVISTQQAIIESQQKTIEWLTQEMKKITAQADIDAGCADVG